MCRKIKTTLLFMGSASWRTDISSFFYSDISLFLIDYARYKLCNTWLLLFENISRSYHYTGASHRRKKYCCNYYSRLGDRWKRAIPEKIHTSRLRTLNFQGYWRNGMWILQRSIKKDVKFPGSFKKNPLVFNFGVFKRCPIILQNFQELKIVFSRTSKVKVTNIKIPGSFYRKVFHEPLFRFFYSCRLFQLTRVFQYISNWSKVFEHLPTLFLQYT